MKKVEVVDIESTLPTPSYVLRTIEWFEKNVGKEICFLVGEDALSYLEKWYRYRELLGKVRSIAVYPRYCNKPFEEHARSVLKDFYSKIVWLDLPIIQLSATQIRERAKKGLPINGMVPESIEESVLTYYKGASVNGGP